VQWEIVIVTILSLGIGVNTKEVLGKRAAGKKGAKEKKD